MGRIEPPTTKAIALDVNHLLLRGCILRNAEYVFGVIVYSGHDTKELQNMVNAKSKRSRVEEFMNK